MTWHTVIRSRVGKKEPLFAVVETDDGEFAVVGNSPMAKSMIPKKPGTIDPNATPEMRVWQWLNTAGGAYLKADPPSLEPEVLDEVAEAIQAAATRARLGFSEDDWVREGGKFSGFTGTKAERDPAQHAIFERAQAVEKVASADMKQVVAGLGGELAGFDFRIKTEDSLNRKVNEKMKEEGVSREEAFDSMKDVVRYTMEFDEANYADSSRNALSQLEAKGYTVLQTKNYWEKGDPYSGVNAVVVEPSSGMKMEVQFHTPESFHIKQDVTHAALEEYRKEGTPELRRKELYDEMSAEWESVPVPPGATEFGELRGQPHIPLPPLPTATEGLLGG